MSAQNTTGTPPNDQLSTPTRRRSGSMSMGAAIGVAVVLLVVGLAGGYFLGSYLTKSSGSGSCTTTQLTETGSSLLFPLMKSWAGAGNYSGYNPCVVLSPASTGSGTGQSDAELGLINIGGSDGYLANASLTNLINVPVAISAQLIFYNIPGVTQHLNLNGSVLAMIYEKNITTWNNPWILNAQPSNVQTELNALSNTAIFPIKRADSSGDTFLFSSLCQESFPAWSYGASNSALAGTSWTGATGNSGMVTAIQAQSGSIGYVGISFEGSALADGEVYAAVGDNSSLSASGGVNAANYVLPTSATISQDADLGLAQLNFPVYGLAVSLILGGSPLGAINLTKGTGGSAPTTQFPTPYPIVNLEYTLIKTTNQPVSQALVLFEQWAISFGNSPTYLGPVNFVPLTPEVAGYDMQELATVSV
jgi:phosphate transport system substrate-binding protein